jgi:8-oxo-dGTP pyrophosphatase MutT (NUDIX family)
MPKEIDFYHVSLKLILKNQRDEALALTIGPQFQFAGYLDFPGGRINKDEFLTPFEDILAREIKEEIGDLAYTLNPTPVALGREKIQPKEGYHEELHILFILFEGRYKGGNIILSNEHSAYTWLDLQAINPKDYFSPGLDSAVSAYIKGTQSS